MNNSIPLQKLFNETLFRIPDYQRGYSWSKIQLEEFWNDIEGLLPYQEHYTGMISLKKIEQEEISNSKEKWNTEKWLVLDSGYSLYEVVDGQQRLTTLIILIGEIVSYCRKNNITELNHINVDSIEEKYLFKTKNNDMLRTYKFGYNTDNPSYEYFKHVILEENNFGKIDETFYTLNLQDAKRYFYKKIEETVESKGINYLEVLFKKITLQLKFNIYYIENDFNVYVAFETMNNRGKKLSYLELLKNRLIYLSTLFDNDEDEKKIVRNNINETWSEIYYYLGKNKNHPLSDDEFLQNHWMIYFGYQTRKLKGGYTIPYNVYILNKYFIKQNIDLEEAYTYYLDLEEDSIENGIQDFDEEETSEKNNEELLTLKDIQDYVNSLKTLIPHWYEMYFPSDNQNHDIYNYLFRIRESGFVNSKPLITVLLSKQNISKEDKILVLKNIERYNFLHYRLNGYMATYNNSIFYNLARDLYYDKIGVNEILEVVKNIDYINNNNVIRTNGVKEKFRRLFNRSGFYSWGSIKYVLYVYDISNSKSPAERRIDPTDYFTQDTKDRFSVEHIYPQKANNSYWKERFDVYSEEEQHRLLNTIGNLLPLSQRINSGLQNKSFTVKKERFKQGSISEIIVSQKEEWTPETILNRSLKLFEFMEHEWEFKVENIQEKFEILGLEFMYKEDNDEGKII